MPSITNWSFTFKIASMTAISLIALASAIGLVVFLMLNQQMQNYAVASLETNMRIAWSAINQHGSEFRAVDEQLFLGDYKVNDQFEIVDSVKQLAGGVATVFMGDTRISTNVLKANGSRAIGTKLASGPAYDAVLGQGKSYRGVAEILGEPYLTGYDPIKDAGGKVIGILFVGVKERDFFAIINQMLLNMFGIVMIITALLGSLVFMAIRRLIRPLHKVIRVAKQVSQGDLSAEIIIESNDDLGQLSQAMKTMSESLRHTVSEVQTATYTVNTAADEIAQGSTDLSQRTEAQAASLEETASSMEQLASTIQHSADHSNQAHQLADTARIQAEQGSDVVHQAIAAMQTIQNSSHKIADIIGVIDEIAFQTNLLALNAAVEAARAGEQGRGFAVVASEVRKLAQRSADAAKQIKTLISNSVSNVEAGSQLVNSSGRNLEEILIVVNKVNEIVAEMANASREQASAIGQVNTAIMQIDQATQQNAALVEQTATASQIMSEQASKLEQLMGFFKLGNVGLSRHA